MSNHDVSYLVRETDAQPLHYVLQLELDGDVAIEDVRRSVAERLPSLPLAYRRLRYPWLAGRPVWVDDSCFAVERMVTAYPGRLRSDADLHRAWTELTSARLPRDRPLWHLTVGEGPPGRSTLWLRVHHAMMDGALVADFLDAIFGRDRTRVTRTWRPRRAPSRLELLGLVLLRRLVGTRSRLPRRALVIHEDTQPDLPTSLTGPVSPQRTVAYSTVPLSVVKDASRRTGVTINDLFLATATEALHRFLPDCPDPIVALVPRSVRTERERQTIGNRAWSILVALPTGVADADERRARIVAQTALGKRTRTTHGTQGWRFDVALSNVMLGRDHEVAGYPVMGVRVSVPLQGENRLVGVLTSHDDEVTVTWTGDGAQYPQLASLAELTCESWLRSAAEVGA